MPKRTATPPTPIDEAAFTKALAALAEKLEDIEDDDESVVDADDVAHFAEHYESWAAENPGHTWEDLYAYEGIFDQDPDGFESTLIPAMVAREIVPAAKKPKVHAALDLTDERAHRILFGDTTIEGDLTFEGWLIVVGDLTVRGVIAGADEASTLLVAGNVRAKAIDTYQWQCGVAASGMIEVEEVLAVGQSLIALGVKTAALFEGEGFWDAETPMRTKARFNYADLDEEGIFDAARAGEGELAKLFVPALFVKNEELADQYAFLERLFDHLRAGKKIWK